MDDWEKIISYESLYKAHMRARLGKRHKKEVIQFEMDLSSNLWKLHFDLKYGRYRIGGYHMFMIYDPKEREIQAITYRDRIVQHSVCDNFLIPLLERRLIYDNAACRKNKGSSFAIRRLRSFMCKHYKKFGFEGYFVKIDISKYFNSIDHDILKTKLKNIVVQNSIRDLLFSIIDSYEHCNNVGLPMGNQTSQCFALLYLDCLDRYFKETMQIKYYVRYMDDIIMIVSNKQIGVDCLKNADEILRNILLKINRKSQIVAFKNGVEFLGWRFRIANNGKIIQKLRRNTRQRIIAKIKKRDHTKETPGITKSLVSYRGFLMRSNSFGFFNKIKHLSKIKFTHSQKCP